MDPPYCKAHCRRILHAANGCAMDQHKVQILCLDLRDVAYHAVQASFTGREVADLATLEGISEIAAILRYCC